MVISIIVPVYKAEKYLSASLESILGQTFQQFELILVDDGSPDRSGEICDQYAAKDPRIRVIHQPNQGATAARRTGVNASAPDSWITFVDADDTLEHNALEILKNEAEKGTYDIVTSVEPSVTTQEMTAEELRTELISPTIINPSPWGQLIHRSLFNEHTLDIPREIWHGEDMLMNIRLAFANTKPVRLVNKHIYNYIANENSISHPVQTSLEYEVMFRKHLLASIPDNLREQYMPRITRSSFYGLILVAAAQPHKTWRNSPYLQQILADVHKYNIYLNPFDRRKLKTRTRLGYKLVVIWQKIDRRLHKYLKL